MRPLRALVLALTFSAATALSAAAAPSQPPDEFIRALSHTAIDSLSSGNLGEVEREKRFRALLNENFDVPSIARFVLGLYWPRATEAQRKEYLGLFEDFIVKAYAKRFADYSGDGFKTGNVTKVTNTDAVVSSLIKSSDAAPPARVDWRVRTEDSHYKIVDVMVEGISMSVTHRDEFAAVIRNNGGTVGGLIDALKKKTH
jgi:phospholipid transport system substrate-binding protein